MRAAGVSSATVFRPVLAFSSLALILTALASLWLTPLSLHLESKVARNFAAAQLTGDIESRIFDEQFPNMVLYVDERDRGRQADYWHQVFIADVTPPASCSSRERIAAKVHALSLPRRRFRIPIRETTASSSICGISDQRNATKKARSSQRRRRPRWKSCRRRNRKSCRSTKRCRRWTPGPLYKRVYRPARSFPRRVCRCGDRAASAFRASAGLYSAGACWRAARISSRKGGKSAAFVITVLMAFCTT